MRMQVILDSLFARLGSASLWGGKKGEFRDWTRRLHTNLCKFVDKFSLHILQKKEKNCSDLILGESFCIFTFSLFSDCGLSLLNG